VPVAAAVMPAQTATQRTVTFASPSSNTPVLQQCHQEDPTDPFITHTEVLYFFSILLLFSEQFF
jgi:hypothetical protein